MLFHHLNYIMKRALFLNEINALKTLSKNKDLIKQKSDKGSSIVLINKSDYLDKMYNKFPKKS